jgi:hypothetical protein
MSNSLEDVEAIDVCCSKMLGILLTACSSLSVFLNFYLFLLTGDFPVALISSIIVLIVGIFYLIKISFFVTKDKFYIYNFLEILIKQFSLSSLENLIIKNNKLYLQMYEERKNYQLQNR